MLSRSEVSDSLRPRDCSLPGPSVHGTVLTRILEWVVIFSSRGSSWPWDWTCVSCISGIAGRFFTTEQLGKLVKARLLKCMQISPCKYHSNRMKYKTHIIISIDTEETSDKIQHLFIVKPLHKLGKDRNYLNILKVTQKSPQVPEYSIVKSGNFSYRIRNKVRMCRSFHFYSTYLKS